jgi:hypothetical protein
MTSLLTNLRVHLQLLHRKPTSKIENLYLDQRAGFIPNKGMQFAFAKSQRPATIARVVLNPLDQRVDVHLQGVWLPPDSIKEVYDDLWKIGWKFDE